MKDKVKAVFEEVKMPEQTAKKIEQAMRKNIRSAGTHGPEGWQLRRLYWRWCCG